MSNPIPYLLSGLAALVSTAPASATEYVYLANHWSEALKVIITGPAGQDRARLTVQEFHLDSGDELYGGIKALDLSESKLPQLTLHPGHAINFACVHAAGTSITVPVHLSGHDPASSTPFTVGLLLTSKASLSGSEVTLESDPTYADAVPPFRLLRMGADTEEEDGIVGFSIYPHGTKGAMHHRLRSMHNMSSVSGLSTTQTGCNCVIL
jgi:hypothetical protein